jgi:hypothetical protein
MTKQKTPKPATFEEIGAHLRNLRVEVAQARAAIQAAAKLFASQDGSLDGIDLMVCRLLQRMESAEREAVAVVEVKP